MKPVIVAKGLSRHYRKGSEIIRPVDGLDLTVDEGEFVSIMGPSGSGKSTLLHLLGALDVPDAGSLEVAGSDLTRLNETARCRFRNTNIGFVFQVFNLIPVLTAYENVDLPLRLMSLTSARRRQQVELALSLVGLEDRMAHRPGELSGGQQQRVAIARALVTDPKIVLADEPTGDLDEKSGNEIVELLQSLHEKQKKTVLMVTHDLPKAKRASRRLWFQQGRLVPHESVAAEAGGSAARQDTA